MKGRQIPNTERNGHKEELMKDIKMSIQRQTAQPHAKELFGHAIQKFFVHWHLGKIPSEAIYFDATIKSLDYYCCTLINQSPLRIKVAIMYVENLR